MLVLRFSLNSKYIPSSTCTVLYNPGSLISLDNGCVAMQSCAANTGTCHHNTMQVPATKSFYHDTPDELVSPMFWFG